MGSHDLVRDRSTGHRDAHHVSAGTINGLAHCFGYFVRLAGRKTNSALTVADGDERVEREAASALYDLGDAIDCDDVLDELGTAFATTAITITAAFTVAPSAATATLTVASATAALTASTTWRAASAAGTRASASTTTTAAATPASTASSATTTGASAHAWTLLLWRRW
jgi:hypothetical protein